MRRLSGSFAVLLLVLLMGTAGVSASRAASDAEIEACLSEGKILKGGEELIGLTRPLKVEVECGDRTQTAVFKSLDVHKLGLYTLANGSTVFNFSDCFEYERAAYLLDRELGLDMVPVAVIRKHQGREGALVAWIPDAVHSDRISDSLDAVTLAALVRQESVMHLFDSLIFNTDRRPPNTLINESTGKLYLIDHTQAFREEDALQEDFAQNRTFLTEEIYARLLALDEAKLKELTKGLLTSGQRKSLLLRRDLIIVKLDRERSEVGDELFFVDLDR